MELAIIAQNKIYQDMLVKVLADLSQNVRAYAYHDTPEELVDAIVICVVSENSKEKALTIARKNEAFAILLQGSGQTSGYFEEFRAVFKSPVKMGLVAEAVAHTIKHHLQKERLKPLFFGESLLNPRTNEFKKTEQSAPVKLTEKEQDILLYLFAHNGTSVSRQKLLDHVWGYAKGVETHTLETHIYRLRQKVENNPANPDFLMTNDDGYYLNF